MLTVEEYDAVSRAADAAHVAARETGIAPINPHPVDTEAFAIWDTRMIDLPVIYGHVAEDFEVLGTPTPVKVIAKHEDGTVTYAIPAPGSINR